MRLNSKEKTAIKEAIHKNFGPGARVFLFGSRVDDQKKGGDIDLYVETGLTGEELLLAKLLAMGDIQQSIGEQKIDILTASSKSSQDQPLIVQNAKQEGILL